MSSRFFRAASDSESESESEEELMSDSGDEAQDAGARRGKDSDDSDEDSDEGNDDDDDDGEENKAAGVANKASRFLKGADSDSDSEDEVRKVIKSAKDKRADEIEGMAKKIDEAQRINDWIATSKGERKRQSAAQWRHSSRQPSSGSDVTSMTSMYTQSTMVYCVQ